MVTTENTAETTTATATRVPAVRRSSGRLLLAGALAGPVFFASALAQALTREGFDITRHPISLLSTGDLGWVQITTFVLAGVGGLALAAGVRLTVTEGIGRRALPILVTIFGAGMIAAGLLPMDPENGFPAGTPDGPVAEMSWHGVAHSAAAAVSFTALAVAAIVLAVRCARRRAVPAAIGNGVAALVLLLPMSPDHMSIQIAVNGLVAFTWTTVLAVSLARSPRRSV
ncbi:hypothetical protein Skr01_28980 [Sphaerisporangium krabiense]|uniref:DUF998 domain-containing protein n=1 Tax=Sphaerisporangium krabiense TaxID=763782 RepID=A0A7W8ZA97_9ACTN|nr:DUF998 domain-containing protein [Sphaerisporangium krabiense]MBB5630236.1 hypothetical protein [Sphaerisporangium krabiense]GII62813.1 hypothetical protein Skr01_28980 [Sphaerisporangium krabiense]